MSMNLRWATPILIMMGFGQTASADVITEWNERAVILVNKHRMPPPQAERVIACMHVAMFDAVNSIEPRYQPYRVSLSAPKTTSKEAAAAVAGGTVLATLFPQEAGELNAAIEAVVANVPNAPARLEAVRLGKEVGTKTVTNRHGDGADAPDAYRPKTRAGVYVPTPITASSMWPNVRPFAMESPSQFRPEPPIALTGAQWASDYNEIKALGEKNSKQRTARQTEDAQFWLVTGPASYYPIARQLVSARKMDVVDSARFMALASTAVADSFIAVFDAKYHYEFWRPITAIRNGDADDNQATELEATWQPVDNTPMHPEYPCAHCISSAAIATVIEAVLGGADIPEVSMTSATAPGVTHRWTNVWTYADEVAAARIYAGFHYRFSARVGQDMGRKIGQLAVQNLMRPANVVQAP
jgi:hypothetical protein